MADWWESSPRVGDDQWWQAAPLADEPADKSKPQTLDDIKKQYRAARMMGESPELLARLADKYVAQEAGEGGFGLALDDVVRSAARGVPILGGALDEISATADSLTGGDYQESLDYQRARDRYRQNANPETNTAVELAGGIAGTIAGARALGVGYGAGSNVPLLQRAVTGGAVTAPIVGADSFARGEGGAESRGESAALGAAIGLPLGAAAPIVAQGFTSGVQRLAGWLTSDQMLRRLGISRNAANVLLRQLQTDDTLTGRGAARIRQGGPDSMVADAGPAASNLLDTALERSGPGATAAREAIEQRAAAANQNLTQTMDATFGRPVGVETRQAGIRQGTQQARQTAYDDAYSQPIDYADPRGQELWQLLVGRVPNEAVQHANRLMRAEGHQSQQIVARVNQNGTVTFERLPDVRQIDYLTRALNAVARGAEGQGQMGGMSDVGRVYQNLSGEIRRRVRDLVPEYGAALDTAADPIRRIQATEFGSTILNRAVTREQVAEQFAGMGAAERRAAIQGMRDQIDEIAANVKAMASDPNIQARELREVLGGLTSRAARDKIATAIGHNQARNFNAQMGRAMRALELRASVARGSRTFGRQSTDAQVNAQIEPGVIGLAMQGEVPRAIKKAVQRITGVTLERQLAMQDELYGEISRALTQVRGRDAERYLTQLRRALQARLGNARSARATGTIAADAYLGATIRPTSGLTQPAP